MKKLQFLLITFLLFCAHVNAQELDSLSKQKNSRLKLVVGTSAITYSATMYGLWQLWYSTTPPADKFHWVNDNAHWMSMDKLGHAYSNYASVMAFSKMYRWTGLTEKQSVLYGGLQAWVMVTFIDVLDGFSSKWGASYGDMIANTSGIALYSLQRAYLKDQFLYFKWSYYDVGYADQSPAKLGEDMRSRWLHDYNGQTYWFSFNVGQLSSKLPDWFSVALGVGANGMLSEIESTDYRYVLNDEERYRQLFMSFDVNWNQVPIRCKFLKKTLGLLNYIKMPFPALEYNQKAGMQLHFIYF